MIDSLRLGNFKAFGDTQTIPLRPLTLIYGPNSAGKSTIIHSLALIHHAMATGDLDVHYPEIGGSSIDLGGFQQFVHRRDAFAAVEWGARFRGAKSGNVGVVIHFALPHEQIFEERVQAYGETTKRVKVPTGRFLPSGPPRIDSIAIEQGGESLLTMARQPDGAFFVSRISGKHPFLTQVFKTLVEQFTTSQQVTEDDLGVLSGAASELVGTLRWVSDGFLPSRRTKADQAARGAGGVAVSRGQRASDLTKAVNTFLPSVLEAYVDECIGGLRNEIGGLSYLGPLRSYPPRHFAFTQQHEVNWRAGGEWAWHAVARRSEIREQVNQWLGSDWLKTKYQLVLRDLLPADFLRQHFEESVEAIADDAEKYRDSELVEELREEGLEDIDEIVDDTRTSSIVDPEGAARRWIAEIVQTSDEPPLKDLVFIDTRSGTRVSHRDVGIGVSQVLPVLVTAFASERRLIALEQPELHLHPALQSELADVFISSALGPASNAFLIETHSEHLLLRVMRRMRETFEKRLPVEAKPVGPDDVCVLYVEPDGSRSIVREMPLNERGELLKTWPEGFFEEGLREVFA